MNILYTDHKPLVSIIESCEPNTLKHQRWCDKFSKFPVDIVYHSGKANLIADALPRVVRKDFSITNVCISSNSLFNSDILFTSVNNLIVLLIPPVVNNSPIDSSILIQEKNEEFISEFMYKFLTNRFIKIDNNLYFRDGERLRKIIDDPYEKKLKLLLKSIE